MNVVFFFEQVSLSGEDSSSKAAEAVQLTDHLPLLGSDT